MRPLLLSVFFGTASLVLITACGGSHTSVLTGDFTEVEENFDEATVELTYYDSGLGERVVLGHSAIEDGRVEISFSFDEAVPRYAFLSISQSEPDSQFFTGRSVLIEKNANYTIDVLDGSETWIVVRSDGKYAHLELSEEVEIAQHKLRSEMRELRKAKALREGDETLPSDDGEAPDSTSREPSKHADVLDWENMSCTDYADEYTTFWERYSAYADQQRSAKEREILQRLDDLYEKYYVERLQHILSTPSDPIERLLIAEGVFIPAVGLKERIEILQELESELPGYVVADRVAPLLKTLQEEQLRRQNNAALQLGTIFPAIDLAQADNQSIPFSSILEKNELVVLEIWDNYCVTCIRAFQNYRAIYSEYAGRGFEVVSLSFEGSRDDWVEKSGELALPWISAYAPDGHAGAIALLLGIRYARANYVLDSDGCILKRDLTPEELLDFLGARLQS